MHTMHNDKEGPSSFEVENDKRHISCGNVIYIINDDIEVISNKTMTKSIFKYLHDLNKVIPNIS